MHSVESRNEEWGHPITFTSATNNPSKSRTKKGLLSGELLHSLLTTFRDLPNELSRPLLALGGQLLYLHLLP